LLITVRLKTSAVFTNPQLLEQVKGDCWPWCYWIQNYQFSV